MKKLNSYLLIIFLSVFCLGIPAVSAAQPTSQAYIGVQVAPAGLPEILTKHLQLPQGQGLLISNILKDSPADKAGLEKDDIVLSFNNIDITSYEQLVEAISKAGADEKVSMTIIHLGEKKTVKISPTERPSAEPSIDDWKYALEPQQAQILMPGRMFHLAPEDSDWIEVPLGLDMPGLNMDSGSSTTTAFTENYIYNHSEKDGSLTVTIQGNPEDEKTPVIVKSGKDKFSQTIGTVDQLPKKFLDTVKADIQNARKIKIERPDTQDKVMKYHFDKIPEELNMPRLKNMPKTKIPNMLINPLNSDKKLKYLEQRINALEKKIDTLLKKLSDNSLQVQPDVKI